MHHPLLTAIVGFALERAALESGGAAERQLAEAQECFASCDEGHDSHCDQQDSAGNYKLSCDMHPTTSCDDDCRPIASPPNSPWLGASGTYPSPPPPPPPPDQELVIAAWIYFVAALLICSVAILCMRYKRQGESGTLVAYWCCCLLPLFRERQSRWQGGSAGIGGGGGYYAEEDGGDLRGTVKVPPPALMFSDR